MITHHQAWLDLGTTTKERAAAYWSLLRDTFPDDAPQERTYLQQQRALG